jgi:hypothetical protein
MKTVFISENIRKKSKNSRKVVRMIVIQVLGIPLITMLLLGAIFVIGSKSVEQPIHPCADEQYSLKYDEPNIAHLAPPPSLPRHGCNL